MDRILVIGSVLLSVSALAGQANPGHALVVVQQSPPHRAALYQVPLNGAPATPLPTFPSDAGAPLAIAIDPATREPTVALAAGGSTQLVRVHVRGVQVLGETLLGIVTGNVVGMCYPSVGDLFAATDTAVWRVPRHGGAAVQLGSAPGASAISEPVILPGKYWVAQDQSPQGPFLQAFLDATPTVPVGGALLGWLPGTRVTGVHEYLGSLLGSGPRVQVVADTQGRLHKLATPSATWVEVATSLPIPPGGARRLKAGATGQMLVLGGAADPTLKTMPQATAAATTPVTVLATLPGDPVDFAVVAAASARAVRFGLPCAAPAGATAAPLGVPSLGNPSFALAQVGGQPNGIAFLVAGFSERLWLGLPLPLPFGTCELRVAADVIVPRVTDGAGYASELVPIPSSPSLAGAIFYAQWLEDLAAPRASDALALHVW